MKVQGTIEHWPHNGAFPHVVRVRVTGGAPGDTPDDIESANMVFAYATLEQAQAKLPGHIAAWEAAVERP